jgi:hypothetical protein
VSGASGRESSDDNALLPRECDEDAEDTDEDVEGGSGGHSEYGGAAALVGSGRIASRHS